MGYLLIAGFSPALALGARPYSIGLRQTLADPQTTVIHYTYDPLYRLTQASYSTSQNFTYTYDAVGNRLTETGPGGAKTYTYDDADRLTAVNGIEYTWDNNPAPLRCGDFVATCSTTGSAPSPTMQPIV
jgi:YD repeat-containing protein